MLLNALRDYSDSCGQPNLHADCPYAHQTPSGLGCADECLDFLAANHSDQQTSDYGPGISIFPIARHRSRQGPSSDDPPFDCRQVALQERDIPLARKSAVALMLDFQELLLTSPPPDAAEQAGRLLQFGEMLAELRRRGFPVEEIVRQGIIPALASILALPVIIALVVGREALPEKMTAQPTWAAIFLGVEPDSVNNTLDDVRQQGKDAVARLLAKLVELMPRITTWLNHLALEDVCLWRPPSNAATLTEAGPNAASATSGTGEWALDRFCKTYLAEWSTQSLHMEWEYLHGRQAAPCSPRQMQFRRVGRTEVAEAIADRATTLDGKPTDEAFAVSKYSSVAQDLLRKGERAAAVSLFDMACELLPQSAEARNNRGFCLLMDNPERAIVDFEAARMLRYHNPFVSAGNLMLALHRLDRNTSALKLADDTWALEHRLSGPAATMWDFRSSEPTLIQIDAVLYLADLARTIAAGAEEERGWNARYEARRAALERRGDPSSA